MAPLPLQMPDTSASDPIPTDASPGPRSGEPTSLLGLRPARRSDVPRTSSAELRERDAVVKAGAWGVALSTLVVLLVSALMGLMRGA